MGGRKRWLKIDSNSIKTRLLVTLITTGVFLVFAVAFMGFKTFEKTLVYEIGNNRSDVLSQIGDRVKQVKTSTYMISNLYYYDTTLQRYIKELAIEDSERKRDELNSHLDILTAQFKKSLYEGNMDYDVILCLENGWGYTSADVSGDYDYMSPKNKIWYKDMLFARGDIIDVANYKDKQKNQSYFCAARVIFDDQGETAAYLMITVKERQIYRMYEHVIPGEGTIYIVDQEGTIISSNNEKLNGFNFFNMNNLDKLFGGGVYTITRMRNEKILFTKYYEEASGFTVLEEIKFASLLEPINRVRLRITLIALMVMAVAAFYGWQMADRMTRPISRLCDFMQQVDEANLDQQCRVKGYTEINILSEKLNVLLIKMKGLMEGIKQKEKQKRKMELSFLQAQINPHFMYNTLFSVKCMVDMERNEEASNMLVSFIQLLRSTLSNPDEFVAIKQEFAVLKQYVGIQKFRYDNSFDVMFECDERVAEKKIPKLLIQPLLENAIFHGVELRKGDGLIVITARKKEEDIEVTVEDNGVGISEEMIERINRGERVGGTAHVGILNVKERIQLNFGMNYGMKIESTQWEGTKIILTFPAID